MQLPVVMDTRYPPPPHYLRCTFAAVAHAALHCRRAPRAVLVRYYTPPTTSATLPHSDAGITAYRTPPHAPYACWALQQRVLRRRLPGRADARARWYSLPAARFTAGVAAISIPAARSPYRRQPLYRWPAHAKAIKRDITRRFLATTTHTRLRVRLPTTPPLFCGYSCVWCTCGQDVISSSDSPPPRHTYTHHLPPAVSVVKGVV